MLVAGSKKTKGLILPMPRGSKQMKETKIPHCRNKSKIQQKKSWKEVKSTALTQKYMIPHFPSIIPAYQYNSGGDKLVSWVQTLISIHSPFQTKVCFDTGFFSIGVLAIIYVLEYDLEIDIGNLFRSAVFKTASASITGELLHISAINIVCPTQ